MSKRFANSAVLAGITGGILLAALPARAELTGVDIFRNLLYGQTGPATVTFSGAFFNADATIANPGDFDSITLGIPGGGTQGLGLVAPTRYGIGPFFATKADMDAAYPAGTYSFTAVNSGTSATQTASISYSAEAYTADVPSLSAASYNALQGLSTSAGPLTLTFPSFTPDPAVTSAFTFFSIFGSSQSCAFLTPATTSCTIDPSALTPGTTYQWELDYSDRTGEMRDSNGVPLAVGFDVRTDGTFTTAAAAIPEPASLLLLSAGVVFLGGTRRRR